MNDKGAVVQFTEVDQKGVELLKNLIAPPGTPDEQIKLAFHVARQLNLDPFRKQVMIVKMGQQFHIIIGIHAMNAVVAKHVSYAGCTSGCVYSGEDIEINAEGVVSHKYNPVKRMGNPIGAWSTTQRIYQGLVRNHTVYLLYRDYTRPESSAWKQQPGWMIEKTARAFSLRAAFPDVLYGVYAGEEFSVITELEPKSPEIPVEEQLNDMPELPSYLNPVPPHLTEHRDRPPKKVAGWKKAVDEEAEPLPWNKPFVPLPEDVKAGTCQCGSKFVVYESKSGKTIEQCEFALNEYKRTKDSTVTRDHHYKQLK